MNCISESRSQCKRLFPPARPAGSNDDRLERDLLGLANTGMGHVGRLPRAAMGSMVTATRARQAADRAFKWGDGA